MRRKYVPVTAQERQDYADGVAAAAAANYVYNDSCPFAYINVGCPEQSVFETQYRNRLNMWMQGWLDAKEVTK